MNVKPALAIYLVRVQTYQEPSSAPVMLVFQEMDSIVLVCIYRVKQNSKGNLAINGVNVNVMS